MARRSRKSGADEIIETVARLPWKVGVGLAVVSYFVLHALASRPPVTATTSAELGSVAATGLFTALAAMGQYVLPLICLVGAAVSALMARKKVRLVDDVASATTPSALGNMTWHEFELLVGEAYRLQGYRVDQRGGAEPDGGVDLVLSRGGEKTLVQCKQWRALKVGVNVVRELYGVMAAESAAAGIVVTSGSFTADAKQFAEGRNVSLVDGRSLFKLILQAKQARESARVISKPPDTRSSGNVPACPRCGETMVRREAKRGGNAGASFWGCPKFPGCRGTIAIQ